MKNPVSTVYLPASTFAGLGLTATKFQNFEINGKYQLTPDFYLGAQYVYTDGKYDAAAGTFKPKYHTVGLMADYSLSKRTDVYLQGAVVGTDGPSASSNQFAVRAAIRHKF